MAQLAIAPESTTTANWQALTSYTVAQKLLAQGSKEDAIMQLQDAIAYDPGFARAHADLADNLISVGRRQEGYQEYINALNSDGGERLSRKERDFIKGTFATDTRNYSAALAAFRDYSAFYENDFDAWFYQGYPLDLLDRPADAVRALQQANKLGSTPNMAAGQLAYSYMLLGDHASARKWIAELVRNKHLLLADTLSGIEAFLSGSYTDSLKAFQRNQQSTDYDSRIVGFYLGARLLAEEGRFPEALQTASKGIDALAYVPDSANDKGIQLLDRASIQCHLGSFSLCVDDLVESSRWNKTPDAMLMASAIAGNAFPHLSLSDRRRVQVLLENMGHALPDESLGLVYSLAGARLKGELALMHGDTKTALAAFRKADSLDAPLSAREYLARALLAAAAHHQVKSTSLKEEALRIYARTALRPASVWRQAWFYPPGFVADQMASCLALAKSLGRDDDATRAVEMALQKLREPQASISTQTLTGTSIDHST